ncbi:unnamed protein product [Miscanthus lutarioriparius]|uniref:NB-ARC domain-containing protein n=1 Tax=Miscanthus lutarioriparius TaxID=422564 RepID=A0A811Q9I1_9POAL|nr:unnamed protein product [Miscanthus lutarioriparius]
MKAPNFINQWFFHFGVDRYFIVIDDVWEVRTWEAIELALVENNGSKVITTTQNVDVAKASGEVYKLKQLSYDDSMKLFYTRLSRADRKFLDNHPDDISEKILKKCAGIPLAIITMASLLAGDNVEGTPAPSSVRRLANQNRIAEHINSETMVTGMPKVRSYTAFKCFIHSQDEFLRFKLLRVLDIVYCSFEKGCHLEHLGDLLHLRSGPAMCSPIGIGKLVSLEELRILPAWDKPKRFFKELASLRELRVFELGSYGVVDKRAICKRSSIYMCTVQIGTQIQPCGKQQALCSHEQSVICNASNINSSDRSFFQKLRHFRTNAMVLFEQPDEEDTSVSLHMWDGEDAMPFASRKSNDSRKVIPSGVMPNLEVLHFNVYLRARNYRGNIGLEYLPSLRALRGQIISFPDPSFCLNRNMYRRLAQMVYRRLAQMVSASMLQSPRQPIDTSSLDCEPDCAGSYVHPIYFLFE